MSPALETPARSLAEYRDEIYARLDAQHKRVCAAAVARNSPAFWAARREWTRLRERAGQVEWMLARASGAMTSAPDAVGER